MSVSASHAAHFLEGDHSLACIHCGLCLSSCPTYLETGNENDSPRGRIHLMRAAEAGRLPVSQTLVRHIDLCLGCRACEAACPSGVAYGTLLEQTRDHIEQCHRRPLPQRFLRRWLIERVFPFPSRLRWALRLAGLAKRLPAQGALPRLARDALNLLPEAISGDSCPVFSPALATPKRGQVAFLQGCVQSVLFGATNRATLRLLNLIGYDVITPAGQICCGALYAHSGALERARACARRNIVAFERCEVEAIIVNAAGCGSTLKEYGALLQEDAAWAARAVAFSAKVKDLSEWLAPRLDSLPTPARRAGVRVTYHDACHLAHAQRLTRPPRELLRAMAGADFVELPEADVCCGSAGSYNLTEPAMAARLQQRKIRNIVATGAQIVVTANPGCLLQIQAGLRQAGAGHIQALHLADYLSSLTQQPSR